MGKMRKDVEEVTAWASGLSGVSEIAADGNGSPLQQEFVEYASGFSERTKVYNKFFGVGMFRLLELLPARTPRPWRSSRRACLSRSTASRRTSRPTRECSP